MSLTRSAPLAAVVLAAVPALADPAFSVTADFGPSASISASDVVRLSLSRPLTGAEGRLAILVGTTDWTDLFVVRGTAAVFTPGPVALPVGPAEIVAYLVTPAGEWREVSRHSLTLTPPAAATRAIKPAFDVGYKAQFAEGHRPEANVPPRTTFQDLTFQAALDAERAGGAVSSMLAFKVVGATHQAAALRFATQGEEAARADLAGYAVRVERGRGNLALGGVATGSHRHLINGFESRGVSAMVPLGRPATVTLAAVSGSNLVGWDNILGVGTSAHRMVSGTLAVEAVPSRPGTLHIEASLLEGSVLPLANYNQGLIKDAAESRGVGVRVLAGGSSRLRFDGSFSRSRFANTLDPGLEAGMGVPADDATTEDARYVRAEWDALRNVTLGSHFPLTLTLSAQHERVGPLYRSVGVETKADLLQHTLGAALVVGEATAQLVYARGEDNLGRVSSILQTLTRQANAELRLPVAGLLARGREPSPWLPQISYSFARVWQFGAGLPPDSDFASSHVPDQLSLSHTAVAAWQGKTLSLSYTLTASTQDNRQTGRERADFAHETHQVAFGFVRAERLDASLDLQMERARNVELAETDHLRRVGLNLSRRWPRGLGLMAVLGIAWNDTEGADRDGHSLEADLQGSWRVGLRRGAKAPTATFFVRGATQRARTRNPAFSIADDRGAWQASAGVNLSAF